MKEIKLCNLNDSYLDSYDRIIKADLVDNYGGVSYNNCYMIVGKNGLAAFEVDLTSDFCFNVDFKEENVEVVKEVSCLQDVLDFCEENNIEIPTNRLGNNFILVGGEVDTLILPNLKTYCIFDILCNYNIDTILAKNINDYISIDIKENNDVYLEIKEVAL